MVNSKRATLKPGMTLIELPFVIALLIIGVLGAVWAAREIGWPGFPLGFLGAILASLGVVIGIGAICLYLWPERPVCRNGKCKSGDYDLHRVGDKMEFDWFCRCGTRYRKVGRRFYEVSEDGSLVPYMRWNIFRGWLRETQSKKLNKK